MTRRKGDSSMKKNYNPFFQTIYLFHFLFVLNVFKAMGVKFEILKILFEMQKN